MEWAVHGSSESCSLYKVSPHHGWSCAQICQARPHITDGVAHKFAKHESPSRLELRTKFDEHGNLPVWQRQCSSSLFIDETVPCTRTSDACHSKVCHRCPVHKLTMHATAKCRKRVRMHAEHHQLLHLCLYGL